MNVEKYIKSKKGVDFYKNENKSGINMKENGRKDKKVRNNDII